MFKKLCVSMMSLVLVSGLSVSFANAESVTPSQENIQAAREYIETSKVDTLNILRDLQQQNPTLEQVEAALDKYFEENPAPEEVVNDPNLSLEDIYPEQTEEVDTLNLNEFMSEKEQASVNGNTDNFVQMESPVGQVSIYVGDTGGIYILENKEVKEPIIKDSIDAEDTGALGLKTTKKRKTTGVCYNSLGLKMFTLWAQGSFYYSGKTVSVATRDGDFQRHFWGSTLSTSVRALGKARNEVVGKEQYAEVYSRVYYESLIGLKWAGVVAKSGTVETYVGASKSGGMYGAAVRI